MANHGGLRPGAGRKKGSLGKENKLIKDMIVGALCAVGGQDYLARQAEQNPATFLMLVGKVLPLQLIGDDEKPIAIDFSWSPTQKQVSDATTAVVEAVAEKVVEVAWEDIGDC